MDTEPLYRLSPYNNHLTTADIAGWAALGPRAARKAGQLSENREAARRAAKILAHDEPGQRDDQEVMKDLLSDMFHLCDLLELDMDHLVDSAQRNYEAEIRGAL